MIQVLTKEIVTSKVITRILGAALFVILTSLGAFVRIPLPFTPVPITLQTLFVLLSGLFLGARVGAVSQLGYLCAGALGIPIFTGAGCGLSYLFGPTGGYLWSFLLVPFFIGTCLKFAKGTMQGIFGVLLIGDAIILISGSLWLKIFFGYNWNQLISVGVLPFIPGDLLKSAVALSLYVQVRSRVREIF